MLTLSNAAKKISFFVIFQNEKISCKIINLYSSVNKFLKHNCIRVYVAQPSQSRSRRSFIDFANMIRCATGRHPFDYLSYGCYCGLGGKGRVLDAVDRYRNYNKQYYEK